MITGTTPRGFDFEIDEATLDDMELLDALSESETNPLRISEVSLKVLGKEQRRRLYDNIRVEGGRVPIEDAMSEIMYIFNSSPDGKK